MADTVRNFRILAVYAPPADICCERSGTIVLHAQRGDQVIAFLLSDGKRHHRDLVYHEHMKPPGQQDPRLVDADIDQIRALKTERSGTDVRDHRHSGVDPIRFVGQALVGFLGNDH